MGTKEPDDGVVMPNAGGPGVVPARPTGRERLTHPAERPHPTPFLPDTMCAGAAGVCFEGEGLGLAFGVGTGWERLRAWA